MKTRFKAVNIEGLDFLHPFISIFLKITFTGLNFAAIAAVAGLLAETIQWTNCKKHLLNTNNLHNKYVNIQCRFKNTKFSFNAQNRYSQMTIDDVLRR